MSTTVKVCSIICGLLVASLLILLAVGTSTLSRSPRLHPSPSASISQSASATP